MGELPSSGAIGAVRARELLADVTSLRRRGRRPAGLWPPFVVFGVVAVLGAPLGLLGGAATGLWWLCAGPVGFFLVARYSSQQAHQRGIHGPARLLKMLGIATFAASWLACLWLANAAHLPGGLGWALLIGVSYLAWSGFARSWPAAVVSLCLTAVGCAIALSPAPTWTVQLGVGMVMIVGGLLLRYGPEAP
ncbi:MAG: hypothetical protein ABJB47_02765 [Actinomycetota bacterium]